MSDYVMFDDATFEVDRDMTMLYNDMMEMQQ